MRVVTNLHRHHWNNFKVSTSTCASFSEPHQQRSSNDDRVVVTGSLLAVIDGATSVMSKELLEGMSLAEYVAEWSAQWLTRASTEEREAKDILTELNLEFGIHLRERAPAVASLGNLGPAATITLIVYQPGADLFTFAHVGDTSLFVKRSGNWERVTHDQVAGTLVDFDHKNKILAAQNISPEHVNELEKEWRRRYYNTLGGTGVLNGDPKMAQCIQSGSFSVHEFEKAVLMSDGAENPTKSGIVGGLEKIESVGLDHYIQELLTLYDADALRERFYRSKHTDDISLLLLERF